MNEKITIGKSYFLAGIDNNDVNLLCSKSEILIINPSFSKELKDINESLIKYEEFRIIDFENGVKEDFFKNVFKGNRKIVYIINRLNNDNFNFQLLKNILNNGFSCYFCIKKIEDYKILFAEVIKIYQKIFKENSNIVFRKKGYIKPTLKDYIVNIYINFIDGIIKEDLFNIEFDFKDDTLQDAVKSIRTENINLKTNHNDQSELRKELIFNINLISFSRELMPGEELIIETEEELLLFINRVFINKHNSNANYVFRGLSQEVEYLPTLFRKTLSIFNKYGLQKNNNLNETSNSRKIELKKAILKNFCFDVLNENILDLSNQKENYTFDKEIFIGLSKKIEKEALRKFEQNCAMFFSNINNEYEFISNAQHYGISTRLLDWTYNVYAALLFAMFYNENPSSGYYTLLAVDKHEQIYCDQIFNTKYEKNQPFNYEKILMFYDTLEKICTEEDSFKVRQLIEVLFSYSIDAATKRDKLKDYSTFEENEIKTANIERLIGKFKNKKLIFITPTFSNQRIASQQGLLQVVTSYDVNEYITNFKKQVFTIKINKSMRSNLIKIIERTGHNMFKIMPDLSNSCNTIMKKITDNLDEIIMENVMSHNNFTKSIIEDLNEVKEIEKNIRKYMKVEEDSSSSEMSLDKKNLENLGLVKDYIKNFNKKILEDIRFSPESKSTQDKIDSYTMNFVNFLDSFTEYNSLLKRTDIYIKQIFDSLYELIKNDIKKDTVSSIVFLYPTYYDVSHYKGTVRKEIPPFGILYLAAIAQERGLNVDIRTVTKNENDILDLSKYDIVAYSIPSSITYPIIKHAASRAIYSSKVLKLVGGLHATLFPEKVYQDLSPDVLMMGEGEITLREILDHYLDKKFYDIKGVYNPYTNNYLNRSDRVDLNNIPLPARSLLPEEDIVVERLYDKTNNKLLKIIHIMCSRGCSFQCKFCGNQLKPIKYRQGIKVYEELDKLSTDYPSMEGFCIIDDNFIMENKSVVNIVLNILKFNKKRTHALKWSALSRIDIGDYKKNDGIHFKTISEILGTNYFQEQEYLEYEKYKEYKILDLIKEAGCIELKFGLESAAKKVLLEMNKTKKPEQYLQKAEATLQFVHNLGINTKVFLIYGYPNETSDDIIETIDFIERMKEYIDRVSLFSFVPLPGSPIWNEYYAMETKLEAEFFDDFYLYDNDKNWFSIKRDDDYQENLFKLQKLIEEINYDYEKLIKEKK